jgi:hypothetical protein
MTEQNGASATPADAQTQPPAGTPAAAATPPADPADDGTQAFSLDEARKLRSENSGLRRRLNELEAAERKRAEADLSEVEKANKRIADLERINAEQQVAHQSLVVNAAVISAATKAGFWDPSIAVGLVDLASVEFDENGQPKNVDRLVADLAKAKPRLVNGTPPADSGLGPRGAPADAHADINTFIRRATGRA